MSKHRGSIGNFNIVPLKEAGWEFYLHGNCQDGVWRDPKTGRVYKTPQALEIQEERNEQNERSNAV